MATNSPRFQRMYAKRDDASISPESPTISVQNKVLKTEPEAPPKIVLNEIPGEYSK